MEELAKLFTDININEREKLALEYKIVIKFKDSFDNEEYVCYNCNSSCSQRNES